jgi:hypothetical protein
MTKRNKLNEKKKKLNELTATESLPNPGNFPVGSLQSRAAARTLASREREGDQGMTEDGRSYVVFRNGAGDLCWLIFNMETL